jgi:hypothetical protein
MAKNLWPGMARGFGGISEDAARFSMRGRQGICRLLDGILLYKIT